MLFLFFAVCTTRAQGKELRIVSLNGAISEILAAFGLTDQIVGVDITSIYPEELKNKPQVGHNQNISAEGILALNPNLVIGPKAELSSQLANQMKSAGVKTILLERKYTVQGVRELVKEAARAVGRPEKGVEIIAQFDKEIKALDLKPLNKKVLFIYARGAGTLLASGTGTPMNAMIELAKAENAITSFSDYKPLTAESLVAANPDVILLFTDGLASLGGSDGLLKIPGIAQTTAGKERRIISMDGGLLGGFTLRLPQAIEELHEKVAAEK